MRRFALCPGVARRDDGVARQRAAGEFADDQPLRHDQDAVAKIRQFLRVGGDDEDRHALARQPANELMDFRAGADIDAARRFVENEHFRLRLQPASDDDLLLIAAAEPPDRRLDAGVLIASVADRPLDQRGCAGAR